MTVSHITRLSWVTQTNLTLSPSSLRRAIVRLSSVLAQTMLSLLR
ncbi:hypothetical protein RBJ15_05025 [Pantoea sp. BS_4]|nr:MULTISPECIES: hypothetical protein [Pantoea]